ncbi:helix-turn-helix domain-containing protein [Halomonas sp.]|uniref:helix-turn-helix domain-containing protein n=1 Tax=Halomonas sp. TaxID=1486246 RepID=UPI00257C1E68|nr:helix-turn-helix domain-containing protein [Halomonas sp.]MCJ8286912.1 helix-turn-helix domain-containing protein [Halomonas sp.]NQY71627.1 helix-turn-helix domain-containing protein [Halomonas sp.]
MISTSDRQDAVQLIDEARAEGARLQTACTELGICTNTYRRWRRGGQDRRPQAVRPVPRHALSPEERQQVLEICHRPEFASLPPGQIVPRLLDEEGLYVASESSYYRILRACGEQHQRGRARTPRPKGDPQRHRVTRPDACWSWDVTY